MLMFFISSLLFLTGGVFLYLNSDKILSLEKQYDVACKEYLPGGSMNLNGDTMCPLDFMTVPETCKKEGCTETPTGPFYVYYEMTGFYQNYKSFFKSRLMDQLNGKFVEWN